ncbi:MAG: hypothetical protein AAGB93_06265 [Planctomycetota bacterium]
MSESSGATRRGDALRERAETVSRELTSALLALHVEALPQGAGPKRAAVHIDMPVPMASRILRAVGERTPLAALQKLPGPDPLRRWIEAAAKKGARRETRRAAVEAVESFERLISEEAGDRAALDARLLRWMPEARRTLELRRRQAVFRGLSELEGRWCELELTTILLHPSADGGRVDLCCVQARTGMRALRPGLATKFTTERITPEEHVRDLSSVDGIDMEGAASAVRLDRFTQGDPANVEIVRDGDRVQYLLGMPDSSQGSIADFVIAELNRGEFERTDEPLEKGSFFSHVIQNACRFGSIDVLMHEDLVPEPEPLLFLYRNHGTTAAQPGDPLREVDRLEPLDEIERRTSALRDLRLGPLPRYGEMIGYVATRLGWDLSNATLFRAQLEYPVPGTQISIGFPGSRF